LIFNDPIIFITNDGVVLSQNFMNITRPLPTQFEAGGNTERSVKVANDFGVIAVLVFILCFASNAVLNGSFYHLVNFLEMHQLIVVYSLMNISLPNNTTVSLRQEVTQLCGTGSKSLMRYFLLLQ
jgi:hypothetical protein